MKSWKKEPWRIAVGVISILFIVFMWAKKDIVAIYQTAPKEQLIPMLVTTVAVSLLKVGLIAGVVFLVKLILERILRK
jgi:hypothetical protein